jgi:glycosyltransferase involved in cell wall biosynthesis
MVDCTINISDAEGFGLATLESLSCGTPIIVNMTGGLQEQVTNGEDWFGIPLLPSSKAVIGSQDVPYIYEDRIDKAQFISALSKMYFISSEERRKMGMLGKQHVEKNYNFEDFKQTWVDYMDKIHEEEGSWETRKGYNGIRFMEVA